MEDSFQFSQLKDFDIIRKIGQGSFSIVYKARRKTDQNLYAIKILNIQQLNDYQIQNQLKEITILSSIRNSFLVDYKEAFLQQDKMQMCIVMEYIGGGDLRQKIKNNIQQKKYFNEKRIWLYFLQTLIGLKSLHDQKIIHRDIKSANLFLSQDHKKIKLGDLNVAKIANQDCASTRIGTPYYLAPEIWHNKTYDYKCDIYSLGCVVYEMAALKVPFRGKSLQQIFQNILKGEYHRIPSEYSNQLSDVIKMMLQKDPSQRPTLDEILNLKIVQEKLEFFQLQFLLNDFQSIQNLNCKFEKTKNLKDLENQLPRKKCYRMRSTKLISEDRMKHKRYTVCHQQFSQSPNFSKNRLKQRLLVKTIKNQQNDNKRKSFKIPSIKLLPQLSSTRSSQNQIFKNSSKFLDVVNHDQQKRKSIITKSFRKFLRKFKSKQENQNLLI